MTGLRSTFAGSLFRPGLLLVPAFVLLAAGLRSAPAHGLESAPVTPSPTQSPTPEATPVLCSLRCLSDAECWGSTRCDRTHCLRCYPPDLCFGVCVPRQCPGDCDGDGQVRVHELVRLVRAVLDVGQPCLIEPWLCPPPDSCLGLDANEDGVVTADELTRAIARFVESVRSALEGCP